MLKLLLASAVGSIAASACAQSVEVASGNWQSIPLLASGHNLQIGDWAMRRIDNVLKAGKCPRFGRGKHVQMDVTFLVQFGADDSVKRIVVQSLQCPELEGLIGGVLKARAVQGLLKGTGENRTGWYRSEFSYYSS